MFDVGSGEMMLILLVALLLFGGDLPEVGRSVGRSIHALKKGLAEGTRPLREAAGELEREIKDTDKPRE